MTYEQLIDELQKLPKERLQETITIFETDEDEEFDATLCLLPFQVVSEPVHK